MPHHRTGNRTTRAALATAATLAGLLWAVPSGSADPAGTAALRSQAAAVMAQIDRLDARRTQALTRERSAGVRLDEARADLAATRDRIGAAEAGLASARDSLAELLISRYKNGTPDPAAYLLAAGSFHDLLVRVDLMDHASSTAGTLVRRIRIAERELEAQQRQQAAAADAAHTALLDARSARREAEGLLAERRARLAGISARISELLRAEQRRRHRLAQQTGTEDASGGQPPPSGSAGGDGGGGTDSGAVFYGDATWYGDAVAGSVTASGEIFDPEAMTCANPWLPFNTLVRVTLLSTGRSVVVRVNDRGPFGGGVIDLSQHAARDVGLLATGRGRVRVEIVGHAAARTRSRIAITS